MQQLETACASIRRRQSTRKLIWKSRSECKQIGEHLGELDREWDIERAIELNASAIALTGVFLGATADRRFLILPALVTGFLLQHAVQGWCPPVPLLRRMGFRTAQEIEKERHALKAVRGDYKALERIKPMRRKSANRPGKIATAA